MTPTGATDDVVATLDRRVAERTSELHATNAQAAMLIRDRHHGCVDAGTQRRRRDAPRADRLTGVYVIALTAHDEPPYVRALLDAGARDMSEAWRDRASGARHRGCSQGRACSSIPRWSNGRHYKPRPTRLCRART